MGMFDNLDTVSQLLAGGKTTATPAATDEDLPKFVRGEDLDTDSDEDAGARAANQENAHNAYPIIEFIHFGYVHKTHTNLFSHDDFQDDKKDDNVPDGAKPRAIQFRSALEREAILLATFMECTQTVLDVRDKSGGALGGLGKALNAAGNLLGEGGGGSGKLSASDVNGNIQAVVDAAKPILDDSITYTNIHKAGKDLHQARRNYRTGLLKKIVAEKGASNDDKTGGMMGQVMGVAGGMGGAAGSMANVLTFTQGVVFKPEDILVKFFALVALQTEPQVEIAANTMTLNAIKALGNTDNADDPDNANKSFGNPFLPVWMYPEKPKTDTWDNAPENPLGNVGNNAGLLSPLLMPVQNATDKGRQDVIDEGNKVKAFFEHPPDSPPPGTDPLGIAFTNPPLPGGDKSLVPMAMDDVAIQAFVTAIGMTPPLGIPEKVISPAVGVVLEFVQAAFKSVLVRDETQVIDRDAVLKSGRDDIQIGKRLEDIARAHLSFLDDIRHWQTPDIPGLGLQTRPGELLDKGVTDIDTLISDKLKPVMDPVLKYAMDTFADQLELARQNALSTKANTMEWYLGRLPWLHATLFCNLFLPFWSALMRIASDLVDKGTGGALKAILNAADKAKGAVDFARSLPDKADALETAAGKTVDSLGSTDWLDKDSRSKLTDGYGSALKKKADAVNGPKLDQGKFTIPVKGRSEKGTGQDITQDEYNTVSSDHQWTDADDPDKTDADKKDDGSGSSSSPTGDAGSGSSAGSSGSSSAGTSSPTT